MNKTLDIPLIAEEQIPAAGEVLARAFFDDPLCVYTQPDPSARMTQFTWLFTQFVRAGVSQEGVNVSAVTGQPQGVAVWTPPQAGQPAAEEAAGSGMEQWEQRFGPAAYHRFTTAYCHFERVHHQCMPGTHWYLGLLGVSPALQGQGIGSSLLAPVLHRADQEDLPCYLETFIPQNVRFYQHRGFQVVDAGAEPQSKIPFWAMKRDPRAAR
jgi:GNAT superfamily N-acetyltransferase